MEDALRITSSTGLCGDTLDALLIGPARSLVANSSLSFTVTGFDPHLILRFLFPQGVRLWSSQGIDAGHEDTSAILINSRYVRSVITRVLFIFILIKRLHFIIFDHQEAPTMGLETSDPTHNDS
jgi:hypothetical protein